MKKVNQIITDHRPLIETAGIIAAVGALVVTAWNTYITRDAFELSQQQYFAQQQQWNAANVSTVTLVNAVFFSWRVVRNDELGKLRPDNRTLWVNEIENEGNTGNSRQITRVVPYDIADRQYLFQLIADTLPDAQQKARETEKRLGRVIGRQGLKYYSNYRVTFKFQNVGGTTSRKVPNLHNCGRPFFWHLDAGRVQPTG